MNIDLSEIFDADLFGRPATFVTDATDTDSAEAEIVVNFVRDSSQTLGVQNAGPMAWAQSVDVAGISLRSGLVVHYGYLTDEAGNRIQDESGEDLVAENEFTYKVKSFHADAFGVTVMELSLVTPQST